MKIHYQPEPSASGVPLVAAVGFFDGFHVGHREIIRELLRLRRPGWRSAVVTFSNHPSTYLRPGEVPTLLTTIEERVDLIAQAGVDELYLLRFDGAMASLRPRQFLKDLMVDEIAAQAVVVGENFRFGKGRAGDITLAARILGELGTALRVVPNVRSGGERVSSTRIRSALANGDLDVVDLLLGAPYTLRGRVVLGEGRGHDLGYPTANVSVPAGKALPKDGVYRITARHDGRDFQGLVSIGTNPTFHGTGLTVEAWLLDFGRTIYGEELALRDFCFLREQRRFDSVAELRRQIADDARHVTFPSFQ